MPSLWDRPSSGVHGGTGALLGLILCFVRGLGTGGGRLCRIQPSADEIFETGPVCVRAVLTF